MTKATHSGTCQACGSLQRLPQGVLAKHGYTTRWGFFSGTCKGSGENPFEKDFSLIEKFIGYAEVTLASNQEFLAGLKATPTAPKGWLSIYRKGNSVERSGYHWHLVEFAMRQQQGDIRPVAYYLNPDTKAWENCYRNGRYPVNGSSSDDLLSYAAAGNARRVPGVEAEIAQIKGYMAWQRERIRTWKEQDLLPVPPEVEWPAPPPNSPRHLARRFSRRAR